ncbi:hypothetical protein BJV77DRAFT_966700 [Russula vinacea]|nr:hypothetical protein BJV77DRAFT_966700 [Russula vinacea]
MADRRALDGDVRQGLFIGNRRMSHDTSKSVGATARASKLCCDLKRASSMTKSVLSTGEDVVHGVKHNAEWLNGSIQARHALDELFLPSSGTNTRPREPGEKRAARSGDVEQRASWPRLRRKRGKTGEQTLDETSAGTNAAAPCAVAVVAGVETRKLSIYTATIGIGLLYQPFSFDVGSKQSLNHKGKREVHFETDGGDRARRMFLLLEELSVSAVMMAFWVNRDTDAFFKFIGAEQRDVQLRPATKGHRDAAQQGSTRRFACSLVQVLFDHRRFHSLLEALVALVTSSALAAPLLATERDDRNDRDTLLVLVLVQSFQAPGHQPIPNNTSPKDCGSKNRRMLSKRFAFGGAWPLGGIHETICPKLHEAKQQEFIGILERDGAATPPSANDLFAHYFRQAVTGKKDPRVP